MKYKNVLVVAVSAVFAAMLTACGASVTSISLQPVENLSPNESVQLNVAYLYSTEEPTDKEKDLATQKLDLVYESSDEAIATVSDSGLVTAVLPGKAAITIKDSKNEKLSASIDVIIENPVKKIDITPKELVLTINEKKTLSVTETAMDSNQKATIGISQTWKSDNDQIASVGTDGTVVGVSEGMATITVTTDNGVSTSCKVTVSPVAEEPSNSSQAASSKTDSTSKTDKKATSQSSKESASSSKESSDTPSNPQQTPASPAAPDEQPSSTSAAPTTAPAAPPSEENPGEKVHHSPIVEIVPLPGDENGEGGVG